MGIKPDRLEADRQVNHLGKRFVRNEDYVDEATTGAFISSGSIVAITGRDGSYTTVSKAQADVALDRSQLWLAKQEIRDTGEIVRWGEVTLDTQAASIGDPVYLSDTAGAVALTAGTVPIVVGKVLTVAASGTVSIDLAGAATAGAAQADFGAGGISADVVSESTAAAGVTVDGVLLKDGQVLNGIIAVATITAAGGSGGATEGTLSIATTQGDESTAWSRAVQMLVVASDASGAGLADVNANVTFNTAGTGTLVASGSGWALIETDASGAFACATDNVVDETVYFSATTPQGFTDPTDAALIVSDIASATWAA